MFSLLATKKKDKLKSNYVLSGGKEKSALPEGEMKPSSDKSPISNIMGQMREKTGIDFDIKDPIGNLKKIQSAPSEGFIPLAKSLYNKVSGRARSGGKPTRLLGRK